MTGRPYYGRGLAVDPTGVASIPPPADHAPPPPGGKPATTTMPTHVAALLVAGHVNNLWHQWANDKDVPGCCPRCCGPCAALKELFDTGQLDDLYGAYMDRVGGESDTWDPERRTVGRAWLLKAWSVELTCHDDDAEETR